MTGGASGIGRAAAYALAELGAEVTVVDIEEQGAKETVEKIQKAGGKADAGIVDLVDQEQVIRFFEGYLEEKKKLDIFIANAGINRNATLLETTQQQMNDLISVDYLGTLFCMQQAGKAMKQQKAGCILVTTSVNAAAPVYTEAMYCSIKAGLENAAVSLAVELSESGVRVNCIAPGAIVSGLNHMERDPERMKEFGSHIPLGYVGNPEDVGEAIALLCTPAFRYMTGSTVTIDGGLTLRKQLF